MIFDCYDILAFLSQFMTLKVGTIVTTGTPAGVGHCQRPPSYLRVGDVVSVHIENIGTLTNRVVPESPESHP